MTLGEDNVSSSMYEIHFQSTHLSFNDLSYINGLKPNDQTYLCGESYWTGVEKNIMGCNFKNDSFGTNAVIKSVAFVTDNNSLKIEAGKDVYPDSFGCSIFALESTGNYLYPECSGSSSSSGSSGGAGVWDQSTWDNSVFGD